MGLSTIRSYRTNIGRPIVLWFVASLTLAASACSRSRPEPPAREAARVPSSRRDASPAPRPAGPAASAVAPAASAPPRELTWTFDAGPFGALDVVVVVPGRPNRSDERFPVLVAFHGRGESRKGRKRGARGWLDDYRLSRALGRLRDPPLSSDDFEGFVTSERLSEINRGLEARPYRGLIVVCPYLPDVLAGAAAFRQAEPLASFVVDVLLPRVRQRTPALSTPAATGVDGVSLGGRAALLVGLTRPRAFGAVGALQAAVDEKEIGRFVRLAESALAQNPALDLRLLTSDEDYFLDVNQQLGRALSRRGVRHALTTVVGTHSYRFNRGPGAFEMLLFHDDSLRASR